ncbi:glycoside hydrolase family 2 [Flavihumibacter rivuli]|nr:glycosyl hydrolase [Flavihumibacter rivuli]ULQ55340.1 glycoside hydrolase family 2 [Flavihumibacter rivuli]
MNDNIDPEEVRKDIESMAQAGIGRAFIGNIGLSEDEVRSNGNAPLFSEKWWKVVRSAFHAARKNNVELGLFNSPGWSQSGGPWISPGESMRYVANVNRVVEGGVRRTINLSHPYAYFEDIALLAIPLKRSSTPIPNIASSGRDRNSQFGVLLDNDTSSFFQFADSLSVLDFSWDERTTIRSLRLVPHYSKFRCEVRVKLLQGNEWATIRSFKVDHNNKMLAVGFIPNAPVTIEIPEVAVHKLKVEVLAISGQPSFSELYLSAEPVVEQYMEKQLARMFPEPLPLWNEYQWPKQNEQGTEFYIPENRVINISHLLKDDGSLEWDVPQGSWKIIRYGMTTTGVTNSPATPEGRGLELDKINSAYTVHHFDAFVGRILDSIPVEDRVALKWVVADSYETGSQNWTSGMAEDFRRLYGYEPFPWLPVLSGHIIGSADQSNRFLWDLRRLIADRVAYEYVGGLRKVCHQHGLKLWLENYGHWGFPAEFLQYGGQADEVGGEFWNEGDLGSIECRAAASAAHIYGKTRVAAESFTSAFQPFARYPGMLKKRADWSFTEGINHTLLHVYITQPDSIQKPGMNAWFGTEFSRNNTWFRDGKVFFDYLRRCNYLLQQGLPVIDAAYYIGEDVPKMTGIREPSLPHGHQFDYINAEVILNRLTVKDGRIVLPDGMSYSVLVLPPSSSMRPEVLEKLIQLVKDGATIVGTPPMLSPSLEGYPAADGQLDKLKFSLWGGSKVNGMMVKKVGKGEVHSNLSLEQVFMRKGLRPDIIYDSTLPILYYHRRVGDMEIYFLANQENKPVVFNPVFRVRNKRPEWWDATSGTKRSLPDFMEDINGIKVPLKLAPYQSCFIVFTDRKTESKLASVNFPSLDVEMNLTGPWSVRFSPFLPGKDRELELPGLSSWHELGDSSLHNFSGSAVYSKQFTLQKQADKSYTLDIGSAAIMATIEVNGKPAGALWTSPWQLDITGKLQNGNNEIRVKVVNTWVNSLIGDAKRPIPQRRTAANYNPYSAADPYQPSGLLGPVRILSTLGNN